MRRRIFIILAVAMTPLLSGCVFRENVTKLVLSAKETAALSVDYFKVVKVVDGDTIDLDYFGKTERVRMIGVNTPESVDPRKPVECYGKEAAIEAAKLLANKMVSIESDKTQDDRDKYGRMLRYVKIKDGPFYNLEIIKRGFAYEYTFKVPYAQQKNFKSAQTDAQKNQRGLWAERACGRKNAAKTNEAAKAVTINLSTTGVCRIKGNISASKKQKTYHLPTCPDYARTVINPENGDRFFCTELEAAKNDFKKAKNCK